jgi:hypothetical protein
LGNTTNRQYKTWDRVADANTNFIDYRDGSNGSGADSNINKIDTDMQNAFNQITNLAGAGRTTETVKQNAIDIATFKNQVPQNITATTSSVNTYIATNSNITSYVNNLLIIVSFDTQNTGSATLNINSLGAKTLTKVDINGNVNNMSAGDLRVNRPILFRYNGTVFVAISSNSADQVNIADSSNIITATDVEGALQESFNSVGVLANLLTTVKTSIVNAINELVGNIGSLSSLLTTAKDSVVNSINELFNKIGILSNLTTTEKSNLVGAVSEVKNEVVTHTADYLKEVVKVYSADGYGADNTGVASSVTAVQLAIDTAHAAGGGEVKFKTGGTYLIDSALTLYDDVVLTGHNVSFTGTYGVNLQTEDEPYIMGGNRTTISYSTADIIAISSPYVGLTGFRFRGQPTKKSNKIAQFQVPMRLGLSANLGAQSTMDTTTWYALFAVKNRGESPKFKIMPYIRANAITGNTITFGAGGEHSTTYLKTTPDVKTYSFPVNSLVGCDVLIINETVGGRNGQPSGRIAKVTANTNVDVTLDDVGAMTIGDYFLIAPPNFDDYGYMATFYKDSAELRNISDSGNLVKATMIYLDNSGGVQDYPIDGDLTTGLTIDFRGFISPLATGISLNINNIFSTSAVGVWSFYTQSDGSNHVLHTASGRKTDTTTESQLVDGITAPFSFGQTLFFRSAGFVTGCTRKLNIKGWIEP